MLRQNQQYSLRQRTHNYLLLQRAYADKNFLIRMLFNQAAQSDFP